MASTSLAYRRDDLALFHSAGPSCWKCHTSPRSFISLFSCSLYRLVHFLRNVLVANYRADSMGYAFTYPIMRIFTSAPILSYIHYPIISTTMISRVAKRQQGHTNASLVASSHLLSSAKLFYYKLFALAYRQCLLLSDCIMCNSTWTTNKIAALLEGSRKEISTLYPPCDVQSLASLPLMPRERLIFSLAQFRWVISTALILELRKTDQRRITRNK